MRIARSSLLALVAAVCACDDSPATDADVETGAVDTVDDAATDPAEDAASDAVPDADPDPLTASWCFRGQLDPERPGPDYDQFSPVIGSHCLGTNHQDIRGVQKLVFVGDSVTKGTPPTLPASPAWTSTT